MQSYVGQFYLILSSANKIFKLVVSYVINWGTDRPNFSVSHLNLLKSIWSLMILIWQGIKTVGNNLLTQFQFHNKDLLHIITLCMWKNIKQYLKNLKLGIVRSTKESNQLPRFYLMIYCIACIHPRKIIPFNPGIGAFMWPDNQL